MPTNNSDDTQSAHYHIPGFETSWASEPCSDSLCGDLWEKRRKTWELCDMRKGEIFPSPANKEQNEKANNSAIRFIELWTMLWDNWRTCGENLWFNEKWRNWRFCFEPSKDREDHNHWNQFDKRYFVRISGRWQTNLFHSYQDNWQLWNRTNFEFPMEQCFKTFDHNHSNQPTIYQTNKIWIQNTTINCNIHRKYYWWAVPRNIATNLICSIFIRFSPIFQQTPFMTHQNIRQSKNKD